METAIVYWGSLNRASPQNLNPQTQNDPVHVAAQCGSVEDRPSCGPWHKNGAVYWQRVYPRLKGVRVIGYDCKISGDWVGVRVMPFVTRRRGIGLFAACLQLFALRSIAQVLHHKALSRLSSYFPPSPSSQVQSCAAAVYVPQICEPQKMLTPKWFDSS